jgi:hypothetical protein
MKAQVELFRAFLIRCPHCGGDIHYRLNLDGPHCGNYLPARCSSCKVMISRRELLWARVRGQAAKGISYDCDECGRANFFVGEAGACRFCDERPKVNDSDSDVEPFRK